MRNKSNFPKALRVIVAAVALAAAFISQVINAFTPHVIRLPIMSDSGVLAARASSPDDPTPTPWLWPTSIDPTVVVGTPTPTQLPANATATAEAWPTSIDPTAVVGTPTPTQLPVNATQTAEAWPTPIQ